MKNSIYLILSIIFWFTFLHVEPGNAQHLKIHVTGLKSSKGQVIISVFKDEQSFQNEKPFKNFFFDKSGLVNGLLSLDIPLKEGNYGLTLVDDENANRLMDKNFIGIPKEGFGFSNYYLSKLKKPAFEAFSFQVFPGECVVNIRVRYL